MADADSRIGGDEDDESLSFEKHRHIPPRTINTARPNDNCRDVAIPYAYTGRIIMVDDHNDERIFDTLFCFLWRGVSFHG